MLLALAEKAVAQGSQRAQPPGAMDSRIVLAASVALAYGWVATRDWLVQIFDLEEQDPAEIDRQIEAIVLHVADLILEPGTDAATSNG